MGQKEKQVVISNTSPIISLLGISKIQILKELYSCVLITNDVYKEVKQEEQRKCLQVILEKGWIKKLPSPRLDIIHDLDAGESSSIALALNFDNSLVIMDDYEGRDLAQSIGINVVGTVGILLFAKEKKLIKSVKEILDELIKSNRWISSDLYQKVLKLASE